MLNQYKNINSDTQIISVSRSHYNHLLAQVKSYNSILNQNFDLKSQIKFYEKQIAELKEELVLKENMLKFEKNHFEQQFISKEKNLMSEVENVIGIEIEGIEGIADRLPEKERERILRYIRRIRERIVAIK